MVDVSRKIILVDLQFFFFYKILKHMYLGILQKKKICFGHAISYAGSAYETHLKIGSDASSCSLVSRKILFCCCL